MTHARKTGSTHTSIPFSFDARRILRRNSVFGALVILALAGGIPLPSNGQTGPVIVDVNSRVNVLSNPVEIFLEAGTYLVEPIGTDDGGAFNSWNAWGQTTCTNPAGCQRTIPTTVRGWVNKYDVISPDITAVSVSGTELTPTNTPGNFTYFLVTPTVRRYQVDDGFAYPVDIAALARAETSTFVLVSPSTVGFAVQDTALSDNVGGMSLRVTQLSSAQITDRTEFLEALDGRCTEGIDFEDIPAGTDITSSAIQGAEFQLLNLGCANYGDSTYRCGTQPSAPLTVIEGLSELPATGGTKLLSPGGEEILSCNDPQTENDDLVLEFQEPVGAVGFDAIFKSLDGFSSLGIRILDQSGNILFENSHIDIGVAAGSGSQFFGFISDDENIARVEVDEYDENCDANFDEHVGYDEIVFTCPGTANEPPVAQCTGVTLECVAGQMEDVSVDNGSYDPDDDPITLTQNPTPPYNLFPPGMFDVELTVTDDSGESDGCTGRVTVEDTVTPAVSCPNDIVAECMGPTGAPVLYDVTALDQCAGDLVPVCTPASGAAFPLDAASPVTCSTTDASGNTAQCGFTVSVQDTVAPTLAAPPAVTAQCSDPDGTPVALGDATVSDLCDGSPTIGNDAPALFPLGTTLVTWTATDGANNEVTATQEVTVVEPCGINCDLDGNGRFDWRDTVRFAIGCRKGTATWACDLNEDGRFNWRDTVRFVKKCRAKR